VTHQIRDAHSGATHTAERIGARVRIRAAAEAQAAQTRFMVVHAGRIYFEGSAAELLASPDAFLQEFLFMTLPPW
jgi:hypothetical protein